MTATEVARSLQEKNNRCRILLAIKADALECKSRILVTRLGFFLLLHEAGHLFVGGVSQRAIFLSSKIS
uniref:AlNc14C185G8308 protein n=1 Tax=Albugo laibachii Nc14 TaxID=890382 RepID=F0WPG3_9STRA|nr:AlNc14C185G8308 [Albugo laibachii Nc14]|eukprot:CCA23211.1 AlNc14C185G8308 [Albugo laibachii Nc14]